jgi:hypothetical protein
LSALFARWLIGLIGFTIYLSLAAALIAAKTILLLWLEHAASHGVVALQISASKIVNAATAYHAASSLHVRMFVKEKVLVACSRKEKDVVVDCLFWQILQR